MAAPHPDGFEVIPVANRTVGGLVGANTLGLVLHVQAGNGALSGWFNNPAAQASSTWWGGKAGGRQQYGNPDTDKFWAQVAGNPDYHSFETEGQPSEPLNAAQIESVAVAYAWGHTRYGWPFQLAENPGERGLGWHGMGGKAWGNHPNCPGDIRRAQRPLILARAKQIAGGNINSKEWFEMPLDAQAKKDVTSATLGADVIPSPMFKDNPTVTPITALRYAMDWSLAGRNAAQAAARDSAAALAIVKAMAAKGGALTAAEVEEAAERGAKAALAEEIDSATVVLTTKES